MRRYLALAAAAAALACGGSKPKTAPVAAPLSLAGMAGQQLAVLPTFALSVSPDLAWAAPLRRSSTALRDVDAEIAGALAERGLGKSWIFPEALKRSAQRNPTYATDPYTLAEEPLRSSAVVPGVRLPEPLASQLRTLVALTDARYVLAPVELAVGRVPNDSTGKGEGLLKLVILDARMSDVKWVGEVKSDPLTAPGPALAASIGARVADLFANP